MNVPRMSGKTLSIIKDAVKTQGVVLMNRKYLNIYKSIADTLELDVEEEESLLLNKEILCAVRFKEKENETN